MSLLTLPPWNITEHGHANSVGECCLPSAIYAPRLSDCCSSKYRPGQQACKKMRSCTTPTKRWDLTQCCRLIARKHCGFASQLSRNDWNDPKQLCIAFLLQILRGMNELTFTVFCLHHTPISMGKTREQKKTTSRRTSSCWLNLESFIPSYSICHVHTCYLKMTWYPTRLMMKSVVDTYNRPNDPPSNAKPWSYAPVPGPVPTERQATVVSEPGAGSWISSDTRIHWPWFDPCYTYQNIRNT